MGFPSKKKADPAVENVEVKTSKSGIMTIPGVKISEASVLLIGTAPLVCHRFDEKMRRMMEDAQQGVAKGAREAKNPENNFNGARYRLFDGSDGIPAGGIKACFVAGARGEVSATMTGSKGAISVKPDDIQNNLCRIISDPPIMHTGVCRNATGVADVRYRPMYAAWALHLNIEYLPSLLSASQLLQMIAHAGRAEGLCEWRPGSPKSKSGQWGTFRLADEADIAAFERGDLIAKMKADAGLTEAHKIAAE